MLPPVKEDDDDDDDDDGDAVSTGMAGSDRGRTEASVDFAEAGEADMDDCHSGCRRRCCCCRPFFRADRRVDPEIAALLLLLLLDDAAVPFFPFRGFATGALTRGILWVRFRSDRTKFGWK